MYHRAVSVVYTMLLYFAVHFTVAVANNPAHLMGSVSYGLGEITGTNLVVREIPNVSSIQCLHLCFRSTDCDSVNVCAKSDTSRQQCQLLKIGNAQNVAVVRRTHWSHYKKASNSIDTTTTATPAAPATTTEAATTPATTTEAATTPVTTTALTTTTTTTASATGWSDWTSWTTCCSPQTTSRTRTCYGGSSSCPGAGIEEKICLLEQPCDGTGPLAPSLLEGTIVSGSSDVGWSDHAGCSASTSVRYLTYLQSGSVGTQIYSAFQFTLTGIPTSSEIIDAYIDFLVASSISSSPSGQVKVSTVAVMTTSQMTSCSFTTATPLISSFDNLEYFLSSGAVLRIRDLQLHIQDALTRAPISTVTKVAIVIDSQKWKSSKAVNTYEAGSSKAPKLKIKYEDWEEWSTWSVCVSDCPASHYQSRTRFCKMKSCTAQTYQTRACASSASPSCN